MCALGFYLCYLSNTNCSFSLSLSVSLSLCLSFSPTRVPPPKWDNQCEDMSNFYDSLGDS